MRTAARIIVVLALSSAPPVSSAVAQVGCSLSPVFSLFRAEAGGGVVGDCVEPATIAENGDISQVMTRGLAVFRYTDQVIAFTDGQTTWLWGPNDLESRPNGARFAWEPVVPSEQSAPAPKPTIAFSPPPPTQTSSPGSAPNPVRESNVPAQPRQVSPALSARCMTMVQDGLFPLLQYMPEGGGQAFADLQDHHIEFCRQAARDYGSGGVDCFETAFRAHVKLLPSMPTGGGQASLNLMTATYRKCVGL